MSEDVGANGLFYLLLLILPVMALVARRVPLVRIVGQLAIWAAIFGVALLAVSQRERIDPYLQRAAALLHLDNQTVVGKEVRIRMASDGHFWAMVSLGGVKRRMLIDSGATVTALSVDTAEQAGISVETGISHDPENCQRRDQCEGRHDRRAAIGRCGRQTSVGRRVAGLRRYRCAGNELSVETQIVENGRAIPDPHPASSAELYIMYIIGPRDG